MAFPPRIGMVTRPFAYSRGLVKAFRPDLNGLYAVNRRNLPRMAARLSSGMPTVAVPSKFKSCPADESGFDREGRAPSTGVSRMSRILPDRDGAGKRKNNY